MKLIKKNKNIYFLFFIVLASNSYNLVSINLFKFSKYKPLYWATCLGLLATYTINSHNNQDLREEEENYVKTNIQITPNTIFVFDINHVIIKPDLKKICEIITKQILPNYKQQLIAAAVKPSLYYIVANEFALGTIPEQIILRIGEKYPHFYELLYYGLKLANAQTPVPGVFELIKELKQEHILLLLSNVSDDKLYESRDSSFEMLQKDFSILNLFDYNSSLLTTKDDNYLKKPNQKYYEKFLNKVTQTYGSHRLPDLIFFDDRLENVISARKTGLKSLWFISAEDLLAKLQMAGLKSKITLH